MRAQREGAPIAPHRALAEPTHSSLSRFSTSPRRQ
jgi:hypothetical protein